MTSIYLDHNATTPVSPHALEAMMPYFSERFGNPSSSHWAGRSAREGTESARQHIAALLGARPSEIILTSGGSEADNHAISGLLHIARGRRHVITTPLEHPAVLQPLKRLAALNLIELELLDVDTHGRIDLAAFARALRPDATALVAIMAAHNEIGTLYPITEIAGLAHDAGALVHCDAVQAAGKVPLDVNELGVDTLALSAHKLYGPKGIGCLYVRRELAPLEPLIAGGGQEQGMRSGTENVAGLVGFGAAAEEARTALVLEAPRYLALREQLYEGLLEIAPGLRRNSPQELCLPNTLHLSLPGVDATEVLARLNALGVAASSGSACHTGKKVSALASIGLGPAELFGSLRFSLGRSTDTAAIEYTLACLREVLPEVRS